MYEEDFSYSELKVIKFILMTIKTKDIFPTIRNINKLMSEWDDGSKKFTDAERFDRFKDEIHGFLSNNDVNHSNKKLEELSVDLISTPISRYYVMTKDEIIKCLKELHNEELLELVYD